MAADLAVQDLPEARVSEDIARGLRQGQAVQLRAMPASGLVRLYEGDDFMGIGTILEDGRVAPKRLFATGTGDSTAVTNPQYRI